MNLRRIPAIAAIAAAVLGGATVLALGAGAAGLELPELPQVAVAGPVDAASDIDASDVDASAAPEAAPASLRALTLPTADPDSPEYNPYTTPGDDEFVDEQERAEYLGTQTVIAECMAEQGFEYRVVGWWTGQDAQPTGLDFETSVRWLDAYYGEQRQDWTIQDWQRQGCLGSGTHAAEVARAAGTPLTAEVPADDESLPTERQQWREFQGFIAECMAEQGVEYVPYDWWTLLPDPVGVDPEDIPIPGRPDGLTRDEVAAWEAALYGDAGTGSAYRWEDAGCSGYATHMTGNDNMH